MLSCIIVVIFTGFFPNKLQIVMIFICSPVAGTTDIWHREKEATVVAALQLTLKGFRVEIRGEALRSEKNWQIRHSFS